ncbi:MAG: glycosyltransferase [Chloracidobacterium sp.]|nr:glycosyltransferase [Chloracidobacterium sp.]
MICNYVLPNFDFHIANSAYTAEEFNESVDASKTRRWSKWFLNFCWRSFKSPRVPFYERIFVNARGVDATHFSPDRRSDSVRGEILKQAGIPNDATVLLYSGRISPEKKIGLLVKMMKILAKDAERDYRLLIAGTGPQSEWLKTQGEKDAPGKIIQLGHLEKDPLADHYANADVFVHPNQREPFGIAPLEAMASGVPTLAPNADGILTYADNDNAWLVEPEPEAFAAAVRDIFSVENERPEKVGRALVTSRLYSWEASTARLFALYDKLYLRFTADPDIYAYKETPEPIDFV